MTMQCDTEVVPSWGFVYVDFMEQMEQEVELQVRNGAWALFCF